MTVSETKIVTLYDDSAKTIAFAPRTKVEAISNASGNGLQSLLDGKLSLTGGNMSGHVYLTGSKASSSTGNTSQLIFGTSSAQHVAISSNDNALVINPTSSSTTNQIVLYLNQASVFPNGISGNASTATTLQTARAIQTNLASTSSASFNGSANITPGVTGTLAIGNGGTGATNAINARNNLLNIGLNPITSTANDTTANWGAYGPGTICFYSATGQLIDQPAQWGLILTLSSGIGSEVHQIWTTQASGSLLHRGGNASGWNGTWRTILDSSNYSAYAATSSHNHDSSYVNVTGDTMTGLLNITTQGKTITIGSQNSSWCHYSTTAPSHWFNTNVAIQGTLTKGPSYNVNVPGVFISSSQPTATQTGDLWLVP